MRFLDFIIIIIIITNEGFQPLIILVRENAVWNCSKLLQL